MSRLNSLMPNGIPRYIRCYDNESIDRYTVLFTGNYRKKTGGEFWYLAMDENPFYPQGFAQHGSSSTILDIKNGWPPKIGRKCHLGTRIDFNDLPVNCRKLIISDYRDLWDL